MKNPFQNAVLAFILAGVVAGCAGRAFPPESFQPVQPDSAAYSKKVDTFIVVLDTASSMEATYRKRRESDYAREIVARLNRMVPPLDYRAGLLAFDSGSCLSCEDARMLYGPVLYHREAFAAGLSEFSSSQRSRWNPSIGGGNAASRHILQGNPGRIALIVVSDSENILHGRAYKTVQKLSGKLGDRLCIHPILMNRDRDARVVMDLIANIGPCGFAVAVDEIAAPEDMERYVRAVFLEPAAAPFVAKSIEGAPDSDGDGVPDARDKCPNTPTGATVDADGCWELSGVYFDSGQAVIKNPRILDEAVAILKSNPTLTGEVHGHTDSTASAEYNRKLSEARAGAVRDYFILHGIAPERIRAVGYGETRPAATNDTPEGRALNRRAELHPDFRW
jgi:OmpA-OmpF porin, OOP family